MTISFPHIELAASEDLLQFVDDSRDLVVGFRRLTDQNTLPEKE